MITLRPARERGHTDLGWLDSYHTFSFGGYHDPGHIGFRDLRVINEDRVRPGKGFGRHPHRDMEIISYVLEGALAHQDSLGTGSVIRPGDVQIMSAGTGITHSEFNHSPTDPVHFLQIWILPDEEGLPPRYDQRAFPVAESNGKPLLVASRDGRDGSLKIHQNVDLFVASLGEGEEITHRLDPTRHAWIQVARGAVILNGAPMSEGDGAAVSRDSSLTLRAGRKSEILLFDLR